MDRNYINRKSLILLVFVVSLLFIAQYLLTHTRVTIENDGEAKTVYIKKGSSDEKMYEFSLGPNEKKQLTIRSGQYKIGASAEDRLSIYQRGFKGLSSKTLKIKTSPQKQAALIGQDENDCVNTASNKTLVYYSCANYTGSVNTASTGGEPSLEISPFAEQVFSHAHEGDVAGEETSSGSLSSMVLRPYGNGFLEVATKDNELLLRSVDNVGQSLDKKPSAKAGSFVGPLNNSAVSAARDQKSTSFAILDRGKGELILFASADDSSPSRVNVTKEVGEEVHEAAKIVLVSGGYVFVAVSRDPGELDEHADEGGGEDAPEKIDTKVIVVDVAKKAVVKVHKLPSSVLPSSVSASPTGGRILYAPVDQTNNPALLITPNDVVEASLPSSDIKESCWVSDNELYYTISGRGQIYKYMFDSSASFLAYDNHRDVVSSLACGSGDITFTLSSDDDGITSGFVHYKLTDKDHTKLRAESILPLYVDVGKDVVKVSIEAVGYTIKLLQDTDKNGPPDKEASKKAVLQKMSDAGLDTESVDFIFKY